MRRTLIGIKLWDSSRNFGEFVPPLHAIAESPCENAAEGADSITESRQSWSCWLIPSRRAMPFHYPDFVGNNTNLWGSQRWRIISKAGFWKSVIAVSYAHAGSARI